MYDGAAVMASSLNGLQAKVGSAQNAMFVHCYAHIFNLVLSQWAKCLPESRVFLLKSPGLPPFLLNPLRGWPFLSLEYVHGKYCGQQLWWTPADFWKDFRGWDHSRGGHTLLKDWCGICAAEGCGYSLLQHCNQRRLLKAVYAKMANFTSDPRNEFRQKRRCRSHLQDAKERHRNL